MCATCCFMLSSVKTNKISPTTVGIFLFFFLGQTFFILQKKINRKRRRGKMLRLKGIKGKVVRAFNPIFAPCQQSRKVREFLSLSCFTSLFEERKQMRSVKSNLTYNEHEFPILWSVPALSLNRNEGSSVRANGSSFFFFIPERNRSSSSN